MSAQILEALHPELQKIVTSSGNYASKQSLIAKKIKDLNKKGEKTGVEGNMPKGSSRAWMTHEEPEHIKVDGQHTHMKVGTKVVITSSLDKHRDKNKYPDSLGSMQNQVENGDHHVNNHYRTLSEDHDEQDKTVKSFKSNKEHGIFPPLLHHDHDNHEHSEIGHTADLKSNDFRELTKCKSHPKGISHKDFCDALERRHNQQMGKHWERSPKEEAKMDETDEHPLVQKFQDFHDNYGHPPHDYRQKKNLGVWTHPVDGSKHIVARDHGFSSEVQSAYQNARKNQYKRY